MASMTKEIFKPYQEICSYNLSHRIKCFQYQMKYLKKRFNKILVRLLGAQWIAASCTACGVNQCK